MLKRIRVVLDPPLSYEGITMDNHDYLDFEVDFTCEAQYKWFYDLVKDRIAMIDLWEYGEETEE